MTLKKLSIVSLITLIAASTAIADDLKVGESFVLNTDMSLKRFDHGRGSVGYGIGISHGKYGDGIDGWLFCDFVIEGDQSGKPASTSLKKGARLVVDSITSPTDYQAQGFAPRTRIRLRDTKTNQAIRLSCTGPDDKTISKEQLLETFGSLIGIEDEQSKLMSEALEKLTQVQLIVSDKHKTEIAEINERIQKILDERNDAKNASVNHQGQGR